MTTQGGFDSWLDERNPELTGKQACHGITTFWTGLFHTGPIGDPDWSTLVVRSSWPPPSFFNDKGPGKLAGSLVGSSGQFFGHLFRICSPAISHKITGWYGTDLSARWSEWMDESALP